METQNQPVPIQPKCHCKKIDWAFRIAWLFVLISAIIVAGYYYTLNINECTSQPLEYAIKQVKERYEIDYAYGTMRLAKGKLINEILFGDQEYAVTLTLKKETIIEYPKFNSSQFEKMIVFSK